MRKQLLALNVIMFCGLATLSIPLAYNVTTIAHADVKTTTGGPIVEPGPVEAAPEKIVTKPIDVVAEPVKEAVKQELWQVVLMPVLSTLALLIGLLLTVGIRKLSKLVEEKYKIDIPDVVENMLSNKALQLVAWAEEKAEDRILHGDGKQTPGAEKAKQVIDALEKYAEIMGYGKEWQREQLDQLVHSVLHLERDSRVGSTGNRASALKEKTPV